MECLGDLSNIPLHSHPLGPEDLKIRSLCVISDSSFCQPFMPLLRRGVRMIDEPSFRLEVAMGTICSFNLWYEFD